MFHLTLIFTTFGTLAAIKRSNGAQQHLVSPTATNPSYLSSFSDGRY